MYRQFAEYLLLLYARLNMVPAVGTAGHTPFQRWTDRKYLLLTSSTSACASLRFIRKWRWSGRNAWKGTARSALPGISMPFISSGHGAAKRVTAGNAWISSTVRWYLQRRAMPYVFAGRMRRRREVAYQACCSTPDCSARMEHIRACIRRGDRSIEDIAKEYGFGRPRTLVLLYHKLFGHTPDEYRSSVQHYNLN